MSIGGLYPVEPKKCPLCGKSLKFDENKNGVLCPHHPEIRAAKIMLRFRNITKRFDNYKEAAAALGVLRYEAAKADFDTADWRIKDRPRAVGKLLDEWLTVKKLQVRPSSYRTLEFHADHIRKAWDERNLKDVGYAEIERFLLDLRTEDDRPASGKYKHNILSTFKQFRQWAYDAHDVPQPKKWPGQRYDMAYRATVALEVQDVILADIREHEFNVRTWFGVKILATYPSVRPGELVQALEGDFDRKLGVLTLRAESVKTRERKIVPLIDEDAEFLRSLPSAMPHVLFFRHDVPNPQARNVKPGDPLGKQRFYRAWKKACARLNITGVDLYGGTKHSTAQAMRQVMSFEDVRSATMHHSNKAAERYFRTEGECLRTKYDFRKEIKKPSKKNRK